MKKKKLFATGIIAGISAAAGAALYAVGKSRKTFVKERWNADVNNRYKMTDSLIRDGNLVGLDRQEVIELLGINGLKSNTKDTMEYYLASETDEQPKVLILDFSEDNKVVSCTACV